MASTGQPSTLLPLVWLLHRVDVMQTGHRVLTDVYMPKGQYISGKSRVSMLQLANV